MRPRPRARSVPRVFGLPCAPDLIWVTVIVLSLMGYSLVRVSGGKLLLPLVVGLQHALGHEVLGRQAAPLGDLVGTLQRFEPGDRGAGDVDVVGRTERLAEHVVDAGLLEDDARGTTGDHAGTGCGGFHQHAATTG